MTFPFRSLRLGAALVFICATLAAPVFATFEEVPPSQQSGSHTKTEGGPATWLTDVANGWMADIPDATPLYDITIPGTHDSAARHGGSVAETQIWSIDEQLRAGVRFFDIRVRMLAGGETGVFAIHHGRIYQKIMFGDVLNQMRDFLKGHPSQGIVMRLTDECTANRKWNQVDRCEDGEGAPAFHTIFEGYAAKYPGLFMAGRYDLPTMGELRGKILVLRDGGGGDFNSAGIPYGTYKDASGKDKSLTSKQDIYDVNSRKDMDKKISEIRSQMEKAAGRNDKLTLNYLSSNGGLVPGYSPKKVAKTTNSVALDKIKSFGGKRPLGIIIADFPGEELLYAIIASNFTPSKTCKKQSWSVPYKHVVATFSMPEARVGMHYRIKEGSFNIKDGLLKCQRVFWGEMNFTCGHDGTWRKSGKTDHDTLCKADKNTDQPFLRVGRKK